MRAPWRSKPEDVLAGPKDRLDPLADRSQVGIGSPLVSASRSQDLGTELSDRGGELRSGVALVADDRLATAKRLRQELEGNLALPSGGTDDGHPARSSVGGAGEVESDSPKEAGMALAIAVAAMIGERGALDRLLRTTTFDRSRIQQDDVVVVAGGVGCEDPGEPLDRRAEPAAALVEAGLLGQFGEEVAKALSGDCEKAPIGRQSHDRLGDAEGDDLRVCDPSPRVRLTFGQEIVGSAENCREEQVEVGIHRGLQVDGGGLITADFDLSCLLSLPTSTVSAPPSRSVERNSVESLI